MERALPPFEMDEVERAGGGCCLARHLGAPRGCDPCFFGKLEIDRRPNEKALSGERIQPKSIVLAQITRFATDKDPRLDLRHRAECNARRGLLRPGTGCL